MGGQDGVGMGRGRAGTPHTCWTLALPTLRPLPFKVLGRNSPAPPGGKGGWGGWDWSELLGEET